MDWLWNDASGGVLFLTIRRVRPNRSGALLFGQSS